MSLSQQYDIIIAGTGAAGLWTAYYLQKQYPNLAVLLVDRETKRANDRTWCFWGDVDEEVEKLVHHTWNSIVFNSPDNTYGRSTSCPPYHMIRADHFYASMNQIISQNPSFHSYRGLIQKVGEDDESAYVVVNNQKVRANLVFDSIFNLQQWLDAQTRSYEFLWQHFIGWRIKTEKPAFNPDEAVLMDFDTPQYGSARFFYVLPITETEALVEYTVFSRELLNKNEYVSALEHYISEKLGIRSFEIQEEEKGKIPMTDGYFEKYKSGKVVPIGTQGGYVKPTTGFAFHAIQRSAKEMIKGLNISNWEPGKIRSSSKRFFFYDQLLLHILARHGHIGRSIFCALFRDNSMRRILTFLEEKSSLLDEMRIFASLPTLPFLRAILPVLSRNFGWTMYHPRSQEKLKTGWNV